MKNEFTTIARILIVTLMPVLFAAGCGFTGTAPSQEVIQSAWDEPADRDVPVVRAEQVIGEKLAIEGVQEPIMQSNISPDNGTGGMPNREYWPTEGWREALPEAQGMDPSILYKVKEYIKEDETCLHSLLVVRNGYLVFEKYYNGYTKEKKNGMQSVTKSVVSALTGIAVEEGYLEGVDQKVADILPEYFKGDGNKSKEAIRIENLLTMSAGIQWQASGEIRSKWNRSMDRQKYYISLPMEAEPGKVFNYSAGATHLLSAILTKTTGMTAEKFAEKYLFNHLGIKEKRWNKDIQGHSLGNAGLYLTPRDMAKLGYLFLNNGVWNEKQILPAEWVAESSRKQISVGDGFDDYGYCWWIKTIDDYECYYALGYGGQYIMIVPDLDMVIVMTSRWDEELYGRDYFIEIIDSYVIDAVI